MALNRKLTKFNLSGYPSETTESNERLKIWLGFIGGLISTLSAVIYFH